MEVRAKTSSKSPTPLSVSWGHPESPAQWISPVRARHSSDPPPACFVPLIVVAQTQAPPPREPRRWSARRRPPSSGQDRRRETPRPLLWYSSSLQRRRHLFLPPTQLQTHIHSKTRFRTDLNTTSEGSKRGVPRLSNSRLQLERPGARVVPGMEKEVVTNFPGPSPPPLPNSREGGGMAEEGGDGPGKDAELTCDPAGERFHYPSLWHPAPFCQPGSGVHRKALPFPVCFLRSFRLPLLFQKGSYWGPEGVCSAGVCRAGVLACPHPERERMASSSPPSRVLSLTPPAHPSGIRLRAWEKGLRRSSPPGAHREGSRATPTRGAVDGCYKEVWIDSEKKRRR